MNIEELWFKYNETKDKNLKQSLIENYISLVKIVAGRMYNYYGSKVEYDDLVGFGIMGLIDSIDKFDISKNIKFETYAQIRIKGAIIDNIRKLDWIPRSLRKKSKDIQNAIYKLENELGCTPTNQQISEYLQISMKELEVLLSDISNFNISSLEDMLGNKENSSLDIKEDGDSPEEILDAKETKEILVRAIDSLLDNEKTVISLYYYDELTYKEIGHILNLSESRISQIHSKAILKIKGFLIKEGIEEGQ